MTIDQTNAVGRTAVRSQASPTAAKAPWPIAAATRAFAFVTERPVSLCAAAVLRIGYGLLYLAVLLRELPHRDEIWGPGSPWSPALARELLARSGWFSILTLSDRPGYFTCCYALALLTSALFMLGWHSRVTSVMFAVVVTSFHGRAMFMTDGGDNLVEVMAVYLMFTACGRRWSLDARRGRARASARRRRRRRRYCPAPPTPRPALQQALLVRSLLRTVLHNCGMFVIAAQVCMLYGSAGLYKVQGDLWRDGTALHYVLNLRLFQPWPALSQLADDHSLLLAVGCYLTVLIQVAFPFALFSRAKYVVLTLLLAMHLAIAVLLGLPVFSGAMVTADAVFLSDRFLVRVTRVGRTLRAWRASQPRTSTAGRPPAHDTRPSSRAASR